VIVGIFGSRRWRQRARIDAYVAKLARKHPDAIVVSGGQLGADLAAENASLREGLRVASLRVESALPEDLPPAPNAPVWAGAEGEEPPWYVEALQRWRLESRNQVRLAMSLGDKWLVRLYEFEPGGPSPEGRALPERYPTAAAALTARTRQAVALCDQVVVVHAGSSPGTWLTRREAEMRGTPLQVIEA
jgi:hypothetical protein